MCKKMRIAYILLPVMLGAIPGFMANTPAFAESAQSHSQAVILHTNDVHASIDNYAALAAYRQELLDDGLDVAVVDAGDAIQGESVGLLTEGAAIADLMNIVPYDLAVPGNHEFDYGMEAFLNLAENKELYPDYDYICCNFKDLKTGETVFEPYEILELAGHDIAFVGITTPETYVKSTPKYFQDEDGNYIYSFEEIELYSCVQTAVDDARKAGAEYVIALAHLGVTGVTDEWTSKTLAAETDGIDVIIDGHDHKVWADTLLNKNGEEVFHVETGYSFQNIGVLTLTFGEDGLSAAEELTDPSDIIVSGDSQENVRAVYGDTEKKISDYHAQTAYLEEQIGKTETDFETLDADSQWIARYQETSLGDFVADAYLAALGTDIAFVNGGGVRGTGISAGTITRKDMLDVNPWGNEMGVIRATGQQILDYLEICSGSEWNDEKGHLEESGAFIQTSGLTYEISVDSGSSPVILDDKGEFLSFDETKSRRVSDVKVNGDVIDPDRSYTVAGSMYVLKDCAEAKAFFESAPLVESSDLTDGDILVEYVTDILPDQTVTASQYGEPQGRIVIRKQD